MEYGDNQGPDPGGQQWISRVGRGQRAVLDGLVDADADFMFAVDFHFGYGPVRSVILEHHIDPVPGGERYSTWAMAAALRPNSSG